MAKKKFKQPITLREKPLKDGRKSLYLDFYIPSGNKSRTHKYEFLKMYLIPETSRADKELNKNTLFCANAILAQRMVERTQEKAGIKQKCADVALLAYMEQYAERKKELGQSNRRAQTINALISRMKQYAPDIMMSDINKEWCSNFVMWLSGCTSLTTCRVQKISRNTVNTYTKTLVSILNDAVKNDVIPNNPMKKVSADVMTLASKENGTRCYLTTDEISRLAVAECGNEEVKKAFFFSCFCGLRVSDVRTLTANDVRTENGKKFVSKQMVKTRENVIVPLNAKALQYLPVEPHENGFYFELPTPSALVGLFRTWAKRANIDKHITFHVARHTFATLLLTQGADLYTTSKLLGHTDISITQIYADIVNQKKEEAVNLLDNINF